MHAFQRPRWIVLVDKIKKASLKVTFDLLNNFEFCALKMIMSFYEKVMFWHFLKTTYVVFVEAFYSSILPCWYLFYDFMIRNFVFDSISQPLIRCFFSKLIKTYIWIKWCNNLWKVYLRPLIFKCIINAFKTIFSLKSISKILKMTWGHFEITSFVFWHVSID